ncbi:hypothetical protein QQ045_002272 [Rhodiola kirilowii]
MAKKTRPLQYPNRVPVVTWPPITRGLKAERAEDAEEMVLAVSQRHAAAGMMKDDGMTMVYGCYENWIRGMTEEAGSSLWHYYCR